jgi:SAM-dependent methyltransferase
MSTDADSEYLAALVDLHRGLERQGPGDAAFTREILLRLPALPPRPRIADLGCGSGAGACVLARHLRARVRAVDASAIFIGELRDRAAREGLTQWIEPIVADMADLEWPPASIDLLWSEGAAYNLGFERALTLWRPLLARGGVAVVSELSWFTDDAPAAPREYWGASYPGMGGEHENVDRARRAGYEVLFTARLPSEAWWRNYYDPLRERLGQPAVEPATAAVIRDTRQEIALFEQFSGYYGYTFYALRAAA